VDDDQPAMAPATSAPKTIELQTLDVSVKLVSHLGANVCHMERSNIRRDGLSFSGDDATLWFKTDTAD
jgi:hypothetical protein